MDESFLNWFASLAASPAGMRTAGSWALLEAVLLPLPPEILLIPLTQYNTPIDSFLTL